MKLTSHALYLRVADLGRSLRFYRDGLGFEVDGEMQDEHGTIFARARKDGLTLLLSTRMLRFIDGTNGSRDHEQDDSGGHTYRAIDVAPAGELGLSRRSSTSMTRTPSTGSCTRVASSRWASRSISSTACGSF